jgi:hypothetical protein
MRALAVTFALWPGMKASSDELINGFTQAKLALPSKVC